MAAMIFGRDEREERSLQSRLAATFVLVGLVLALGGLAFNLWTLRVQELPPLSSERAHSWGTEKVVAAMRAISMSLFYGWGMLMAFILGSYVMVKLGRACLARAPRTTPTQYVDAWGGYRVTDAEIARATTEPGDSDRDGPPPTGASGSGAT